MWRCVASDCGDNDGARARAGARVAEAPRRCDPVLQALELPASGLSPLFFGCSVCALRMITCECCHALLDAEKEVDGVLLCKRCGFLTVLDAKLRALMVIAPFRRAIVHHVNPSIKSVDELVKAVANWEVRVRSGQRPHHSEDVDASAADLKKRKRPLPSPQPSNSEPIRSPRGSVAEQEIPEDLRAEGHKLKAELHAARRNWRRFMDEAATEAANMSELPAVTLQSFSSTHLNILKMMYQNSMNHAELTNVATEIEKFLLHQSTIVKAKGDLLAGMRTCHQIQALESVADMQPNSGSRQAATVMIHCANEQIRHWRRDFERIALPYLCLVGIANKYLFALYNAAQSLSKMQQQLASQAASDRSAGSTNCSPSLNRTSDPHSRRRRLYGSASANVNSASVRSPGDGISGIQQSIEMQNRLTEIAKKVELWRSLSFTISSTCVLSLVDLAEVEGSRVETNVAADNRTSC